MNYAELIENKYHENKNGIADQREKLGFTGVLTLQNKIDDGYISYRDFCHSIGTEPKSKSKFLRANVI